MDRFPQEFRWGAMGKFVLPCRNGLPYVTEEGDADADVRRLPCPCLSTVNALKVLALKMGESASDGAASDGKTTDAAKFRKSCHPKALKEMEKAGVVGRCFTPHATCACACISLYYTCF